VARSGRLGMGLLYPRSTGLRSSSCAGPANGKPRSRLGRSAAAAQGLARPGNPRQAGGTKRQTGRIVAPALRLIDSVLRGVDSPLTNTGCAGRRPTSGRTLAEFDLAGALFMSNPVEACGFWRVAASGWRPGKARFTTTRHCPARNNRSCPRPRLLPQAIELHPTRPTYRYLARPQNSRQLDDHRRLPQGHRSDPKSPTLTSASPSP